jgi:hypothetical protein
MTHPYLLETLPKNNIPFPPGVSIAPSPVIPHRSPLRNGIQPSASAPNVASGNQHVAHLQTSRSAYDSVSQIRPSPILDASASHRAPFYPHEYPPHVSPAHSSAANHHNGHGSSHPNTSWDAMDVSPAPPPRVEEYTGRSMDVYVPSQVPEYPARPPEPEVVHDMTKTVQEAPTNQGGKLGKFGALGFAKKTSKWGLNMFGHSDKITHHLPPVDEVSALATGSTPSLKRSQSTSTESSDGHLAHGQALKPIDPKQAKKEAERVQREAEKQRRALAAKMQREQARAVMQKRKQITHQVSSGIDLEWEFASRANVAHAPKVKATLHAPPQSQSKTTTTTAKSADMSGSRFGSQLDVSHANEWRSRGNERMAKARRREYDDDHSMSSSDVQSIGRMSSVSFATVDSDPGPSRSQTQPALLGINRITSRTSSDEFPASARSSNSLSAEQYLAHDFHLRASVNPSPSVSGSASPPPMQMLSLSPPISPSPTWMTIHGSQETSSVCSSRGNQSYGTTLPQSRHLPLNSSGPNSPYDFNGLPSTPYGPPTSPAPRSAINPIFKVVNIHSTICCVVYFSKRPFFFFPAASLSCVYR